MGELGARQLCSFDPTTAELYACVSSDNRLRIWNTASGALRQQYVEPRHLAKQYTSIAWHRPAAQSKRTSSGASISSSSALGMIALGTDKGSVSVWDLKRGALAHSLGEGEGLPSVTSVAFSADGSSIFSASSSGKDIIEWNVQTGAVARKLKGFKHGSTQICLHPLGKILAIASSSIRLLDLATGKTVRKLSAGHAGSVRLLSFSLDGRYLASAAASARFANVFDVAGEAAPSEPVSTLGFSSNPKFLALHCSTGAGGRAGAEAGGGGEDDLSIFTVVAGFDTGDVSVLRTRRRADGKDAAVSKVEIRGAGGKASSPSALHACLSKDHPSSTVVLATGSPASPSFAEALFEDSSGALLSSSVVGGSGVNSSDGAPKDDEEVLGDKGGPAHAVGPGELGLRGAEKDAVSVSASVGDGDVDERASKRLKADGGEGGGEEAGMSIAERLEALSEAIDQEAERSGAEKNTRRGGSGGGVLALVGSEGGGEIQPRAESLSTVLTQALQSGDESLLEECLSVGDQGVIEATVERLPSSKVLQFLLRVVAKLEKRPNRAAALGRWIRALLSCHLGYLVSVPGLPDKLALLQQLIDRRVASFPRLLQLHGRLDLLLARAKAEKGMKRGSGGRAMDRPEAVYKEDDEDDEEENDSGGGEGEEENGGEGSGEESIDSSSEEGDEDSGDEADGSGGQEDMDEDKDDDDDDDDE